MNKRQAKKWKKKVNMFSQLECVVNKCSLCGYYEEEDRSVGLMEGCFGCYLYDDEGNFLEENEGKAIAYMECKGYTCPYFVKRKSAYRGNRREQKLNLPKSYREYKDSLKAIERYYYKDYLF